MSLTKPTVSLAIMLLELREDTMQTYIISKTFLSIYRYLTALTKSIDRVVRAKSINSSSFNDYYKNNTEDQTAEILALTNKKITLINIKLIVDQTLQKLQPDQARVLTLKYIDNLTSAQISDLMQLNTRTYFRKANSAIKEFNNQLEKFFKQNTTIQNNILNEPWIKHLLSQFDKDTKVNCDIDGSFVYKTIIKNLRKAAAY